MKKYILAAMIVTSVAVIGARIEAAHEGQMLGENKDALVDAERKKDEAGNGQQK